MTSKTKRFLGTVGIVTGLLMPFANAYAQSDDLSELTAQWWQWAISIPTTANPLLDMTGGNCLVGQHGSVWFLAGNSGGTATRQCSVPEGTALFFPVANYVNINTPNVCGQGPANQSVKFLRAQIAPLVNGFTKLEVDVDGKPSNGLVLVQSEVFAVAMPADNIFNAPCDGAGYGTVPAGIYSPAVDEGFYVSLKPFKAGSHTLHILAQNPSQSFALDVTYHLTVVPVLSK